MGNKIRDTNTQTVPVGIKILAALTGLEGIISIIGFIASLVSPQVAGLFPAPLRTVGIIGTGFTGVLCVASALWTFKTPRFGWWIVLLSWLYKTGISIVLPFLLFPLLIGLDRASEVLPRFISFPAGFDRIIIFAIGIAIYYCIPIWYLSRQKVKNVCGTTLELSHFHLILFSFLILFLPLLNLPPWFSPPEWGKSIVFRVILSLIVLLLIFSMLRKNQANVIQRVKQNFSSSRLPLLLLGGLFLSFLLASLFSLDPNFSFWGNPARGGGSVTFLLLIVSCVLAYMFFSRKHWGYGWTAMLVTACLVALVVIIQWRGWLPNFIIPQPIRPKGTMGNDIQLGMYLIVSLFPVFAFFLQEKLNIKKLLYLLVFPLLLLVIMLTGSRGAYLGIFLGFSYFILLYPFKNLVHSLATKLVFLAFLLIPAFAVYYANTHDVFPKFIQKNTTLYTIAGRLQLKQFIVDEPRFSTWKVGWEAIKARPLLGYGPENFEIGFDRYYDPTLPNIQYLPQSPNSWWDKAHNIFIDTSVQAGIPALLFYLALLGTLFWHLQKIKKGQQALLAHGLQASLIGYFGANLFGFDNFSTLLAFFFLVAYILHLTRATPEPERPILPAKASQNLALFLVLPLAGILLLIFNWQYSIKPFLINTDIQIAKVMVERNLCNPAFSRMEKALKQGNTFLDSYAKVTYFDALRNCQTGPEQTLALAKKGRTLLLQAVETWPYHTRTWIFLGQITALIADRDSSLSLQNRNVLLKEAESYFEHAKELSPKHQEIYLEWIKIFITAEDYEGMVKKAEECIQIYPRTGECWFLKGLAHEFLGQNNEFRRHTRIAKSLGYDPDKDIIALNNLVKAYAKIQDLGQLAITYEKIVAIRPNVPQFYASLAFTYASLGEYEKARAAALKVLELDPNAKEDVELFLSQLP